MPRSTTTRPEKIPSGLVAVSRTSTSRLVVRAMASLKTRRTTQPLCLSRAASPRLRRTSLALVRLLCVALAKGRLRVTMFFLQLPSTSDRFGRTQPPPTPPPTGAGVGLGNALPRGVWHESELELPYGSTIARCWQALAAWLKLNVDRREHIRSRAASTLFDARLRAAALPRGCLARRPRPPPGGSR